jgi:diadenylate cyclase
MEGFSINIDFWNNITGYVTDIMANPFKLIIFILDILIVGYIGYKFIKSARNSRVWQLLKGIVLIIFVTILSGIFEFRILNWFLTIFTTYGVIALIVIFQPELRRMLEQLGTNKFTKFFGIGLEKNIETKTKEDIYKIVIAAKEMSNTKTGGLIVLERDIQLNDVMDTGVRLDADVSPQLIVNLFVPKTPLHDGAIIISKNKIAAAACILPLSDDKEITKGLGTRHRAALGISRETDAIVIVISEETGKISIAKDGTLIIDLKEEALKNILIKNLVTKKFNQENNKKNLRNKLIKNFKKNKKENKKEEKKEKEKKKDSNNK